VESTVDSSAAFAAAHWDALAKSERDMADWCAKRGHFVGAYIERANTYERCAKSLWLEASTGISHCMCHMKPRGDCPWSGMGARM
jgi:hypothetical protein